MKIVAWSMIAMSLVGCASAPDDIKSSYVSPMIYQNHSCDQLRQEMQRVSHKVQEVTGAQQKKASSDAAAMTVGMVLFWPALFALGAGEDRAGELARLKGESEALEKAAIEAKCTGLQRDIRKAKERK